MASLALTGASLWRAMSMRDRPAGCASCAGRLCGALRGSGRPPRGGRRRSFVGGDRLLVANGRCWRRRGSAPRAGAGGRWRRRATARQRATNTTLDDTRRHTATSVSSRDGGAERDGRGRGHADQQTAAARMRMVRLCQQDLCGSRTGPGLSRALHPSGCDHQQPLACVVGAGVTGPGSTPSTCLRRNRSSDRS